MEGSFESWMTIVDDDESGWEALVLSKSLKLVNSTKKFTVLYNETNVSTSMRELLKMEFSLIISIQDAFAIHFPQSDSIDAQSWSKILCWTATLWNKCIFISPGSLVLKPIDELFKHSEFSACPKIMKNGEETASLDLFVFKPSLDRIDQIQASINTIQESIEVISEFWEQLTKNWESSSSNCIAAEYSFDAEDTEHQLHYPSPSIVKFSKWPWLYDSGTKHNDYVEKWLKIYYEHVLPSIPKDEINTTYLNYCINTFNLPKPTLRIISELGSIRENVDAELMDSVAIIGMSCRFPGANNPMEYWKLLNEGKRGISTFPKHRATFDDQIPEARTAIAGFLSCSIDEFDGKFFGISPREAPLIDPQQRLLLEVIWEALENAGIDGHSLKETMTGIFIGMLHQDYDTLLPKNMYIGNEYHHRFLGNAMSAISGRISYFLGLSGPNIAVESIETSSLTAIHLACESLKAKESNLVVAGGVNIILIPRSYTGQVEKAYGEGVATFVMKRYADAVNDGDRILAVVRGSAVKSFGNIERSVDESLTDAIEAVSREVLNRSGNLSNSDVEYVVIDAAVSDSDAGSMDIDRISKDVEHFYNNRVVVDSVEANVGHTESASGVASLFKLVLALSQETIPVRQSLTNLSLQDECVPVKYESWRTARRIGAVCSVSLSGTVSQVILQAPPLRVNDRLRQGNAEEFMERPELITISAKSSEAVSEQCKNYLRFLQDNRDVSLTEFSYAANACKAQFQYRVAIPARNTAELIEKLKNHDYFEGKAVNNTHPGIIGFLFTGQGSQYFEMGKGLYKSFKPFQRTIDFCDELVQLELRTSLKAILWEDGTLMSKSVFAQTSIFCLEIALFNLWKHFGIEPNVVLGHSLGEYAAAVCSGVLSIHDGLKIVIKRSQLLEKLPSDGGMLAVKLNVAQINAILANFGVEDAIDLAAINSNEETVISGPVEKVEVVEEACKARGIKTNRLNVSYAFHSAAVDEILDDFGEFVDGFEHHQPNCVYVSSTLSRIMEVDDFGAEYWQCHLREPIQFASSVQIIGKASDILIEIGSKPILLALAKGNLSNSSSISFLPSLRKTEDEAVTFLSSVGKIYVGGGISINFTNWFDGLKQNITLPSYPFQREKFWFRIEDFTDDQDFSPVRPKWQREHKLIHPLIGYKVDTNGRNSVYKQWKVLLEAPYFKDCESFGITILPPGGILELFLGGTKEVLPLDSCLIHLKNIRFFQTLALSFLTTITTQIRTLTARKSWFIELHCEESVIAVAEVAQFDPNEQLDSCISSAQVKAVQNVDPTSTFAVDAENTQSKSIHFNTNYRRISTLQKSFDSKHVLASLSKLVQDPEKFGSNGYVSYPPYLDSMIGVLKFTHEKSSEPQEQTPLVSFIENFIWYGSIESLQGIYCYVTDEDCSAYLMDEKHKIIAKLSGIHFEVPSKPSPNTEAPSFHQKASTAKSIEATKAKFRAFQDDIVNQLISSEDGAYKNIPLDESEADVNEKTFDVVESINLEMRLESIIREVTRLSTNEALDHDLNFSELGVDSLMGLEIGGRIQQLFPNNQVPQTIVQEHATFRDLLEHLTNLN